MSKLTIVGLHGDRTGVLDALIKMGGVEVIEDKAEGESTRSMAYASNLDLRARLKRAISGLSARFPEARHLVGKKLLVSEEAFAITEKDESKAQRQLNRYETLLREEEALDLSLSVLHDQAEQLMPWVDIPIDLTVRNTNKTTIIYGVFRDATAFDAFERDVARDLPLASAFILDEDAKFPAKVAIVTINEQLPRIRARIAASDFHEIPDLPFTGSASDTMKDLDEKVTAKKDELRKVQDELREIAEGLPLLMTYHDFLLVRYDKNAADEMCLKKAFAAVEIDVSRRVYTPRAVIMYDQIVDAENTTVCFQNTFDDRLGQLDGRLGADKECDHLADDTDRGPCDEKAYEKPSRSVNI
jgi:vacuolar-type H+-ATPase subunit I/STV1